MVCEHLSALEQEILGRGLKETFRGQAWSNHCREWVYFDCYFDRSALRERFQFAECVSDHEHRGTFDGQEAGFVCHQCWDAIMGLHPEGAAGHLIYR
jgi:hypothetical protein